MNELWIEDPTNQNILNLTEKMTFKNDKAHTLNLLIKFCNYCL